MIANIDTDFEATRQALSLFEQQLVASSSDRSEEQLEAMDLTLFWTRLGMICAEAEEKLKPLSIWTDPRSEEAAKMKISAERECGALEAEVLRLEEQEWEAMRKTAHHAADLYAQILRDHQGGEQFAQQIEALKLSAA